MIGCIFMSRLPALGQTISGVLLDGNILYFKYVAAGGKREVFCSYNFKTAVIRQGPFTTVLTSAEGRKESFVFDKFEVLYASANTLKVGEKAIPNPSGWYVCYARGTKSFYYKTALSEAGGFLSKCLDERTDVKKLSQGFLSRGQLVWFHRDYRSGGILGFSSVDEEGNSQKAERKGHPVLKNGLIAIRNDGNQLKTGKLSRISIEEIVLRGFELKR